MNYTITLATCAVATIALAGPANAEHRQLGPHVHGHGTLNMAIEGNKVSIELEAPGMDIVGFEHDPSTPEQKTAALAADAHLKDALELFAVPQAAQCKLDSAKIEIEHNEHHHDADHDGDDDADKRAEDHHDDHAEDDHDDGEHEEHGKHTVYHVVYAMTCASVAKLSSIHFNYFTVFPGAKTLTVNVVSNDRQGSYEVSREKPDVDLQGGM